MENSLVGAIAAGVVCGVLFVITVAIICFLVYRCRRYEDEKSSQQAPLMNGHIANGGIPTVAALVPLPGPSPSRHVYQFPTMPVRHMTTYRPRYIEERRPEGHSAALRSHTYSGAFPSPSKGPVFYDVREHGGYRAYRDPIWAQRSQEEAEATMMLGEESPKSERHFVLEENNNDNKNRSSVKRQSSVISNTEERVVERRSFRTKDIRIPSPDETRRSYLLTSEPEESSPTAESTNEDARNISVTKESTSQSEVNVIRESRRQRRGEDGISFFPPKQRQSNFGRPDTSSNLHPSQSGSRQADPSLQEPIMAVYIPDAGPDSIPEESATNIQRYFINDDVYTVSFPESKSSPISDPNGLRVIGRPIGQPEVNNDVRVPRSISETDVFDQDGTAMPSPYGDFNARSSNKEGHHVDYRVIKSKRRPSWLQNAGQWFSKKKSK